ncbi:MAG TPA: hypothetical protein VHU40_13180 [Polyangia bacterium]|jgi:hypothetical protein|nr:hypothetical protein [Polyangia bacterium]
MLKIREFTDPTGALAAVYLRCTKDGQEIIRGDEILALPGKALDAVMARYGDLFDPEAPITVVGNLELDAGRILRHVRHLAGYDVIARDYLVYDVPDAPPLCALSATVARGLEHLATIARR